MNHYPILAYISLFSPILPIGVGISKISSLHRGMKILFIYLIAALAADIYLMWFVRGRQLHIELVHFYYLIEYVFIMSIIFTWQEPGWIKKSYLILIILYILFWVSAKLTFEPLNGLYSVTASVSQVLLTLGAGFTLFIVTENRIHPLITYYRFWVLLSFMIFYAGTLLTIALRGILIGYSIEKFFLAASIDWFLKILFNFLFTIGFVCPQKEHNP